jgi:hypothetical protein
MLARGSAADPDYATYWPAGASVRDTRLDGRTVTVDLAGVPAAAPTDAATAERSVDQFIYTATAASDSDLVRLLVDGQPVSRLWGVDTAAPLARRPAVDVQAPLWLIEPAQGAILNRTFTAHLAGIVFEATCRLRVRTAAGAVVADQTVTLSAGAPQVGEARVDLSLPPGRYTVEAYAISPADGSERFPDNHEVTVR